MQVAFEFSVSISPRWPWKEVPRRIVVWGTILIIVIVLCREGWSLPESLTFALTVAGAARAACGSGTLPEVNR
jgi:hypothetical protein